MRKLITALGGATALLLAGCSSSHSTSGGATTIAASTTIAATTTDAATTTATPTTVAPPATPAGAAVPPAPTIITSEAGGGSGEVLIEWTPVAGAVGYSVRVASAAGGPYAEVARLNVVNGNFTATSSVLNVYSDTAVWYPGAYSSSGPSTVLTYVGLADYSQNYFRVVAFNAAGNSAPSNTECAATYPGPGLLKNSSFPSCGSNTCSLLWVYGRRTGASRPGSRRCRVVLPVVAAR